MSEKLLITFGPRKILDISKDHVVIAMKKATFIRVVDEFARVQDALAKGKSVVIKKVLKGAKVIYMEGEHVRNEGSAGHRQRDPKRGKKK
jgi:hypothetical protein